MTRALLSDITAYEALQSALGLGPVEHWGVEARSPPTSVTWRQTAYDGIERFLADVQPHVSDALIEPATASEIWIARDFNDVVCSITGSPAGLVESGFDDAVRSITDAIKRALLFAHRIVLFDELTPCLHDLIVDKGGLSPPVEVLEARLRFVCLVYAAVAPLLSDEVVLLARGTPAPMHTFAIDPKSSRGLARLGAEKFRSLYPTSPLVAADRDYKGGFIFSHGTNGGGRLNFNDQKNIELLAQMLIEALIPMRLNQPRLDPCFTNLEVARLYGQLLKEVTAQWSRFDLERPLICTELATNAGIHPGAVTIGEAAAIRRDEEIFAQWRSIVRETVRDIVSAPAPDDERSAAFEAIVRDREAEWRARFNAQIDGSVFLKTLIDPRQSILTGLWAGGLYSLATGEGHLAAVAVAAGSGIARDVLTHVLEATSKRDRRTANKALRSHFMAVGAKI